MADVIGMDHLEQITAISFPNDWFYVWGPSLEGVFSAPVQYNITFPDQAGGTPGLTPIEFSVVGSVPVIHLAPYVTNTNSVSSTITIKQSDINSKLITGAGAKLAGHVWGPIENAFAVIALFNFGSFPSSRFRVRLGLSGDASAAGSFVTVGTIAKNTIKAGYHFVNIEDIPTIDKKTGFIGVVPGVGGSNPIDFTINPATKQVQTANPF